MKKLIPLLLLACSLAWGQTQINIDQRQIRASGVTIATLPATPTTGELALVTDGLTPGDCTGGTGSSVALCRYNGTAWEAVSESSGEVFNVIDYGAVCDAATDDEAAIQLAINAAAGRGIVLFPGPDLCLAQDTLEIPSNSHLAGLGHSTGLSFDWHDGSPVSYIINSDTAGGNTNITLENFTIEGAADGDVLLLSQTGAIGVLFQTVDEITVRAMRFYRIPSIPLSVRGYTRAMIANNFFIEGGAGGFHSNGQIASPQSDLTVVGNIIFRSGDDALAVHSTPTGGPASAARSQRGSIIGNTIIGWDSTQTDARGSCVVLTGAENYIIANNSIRYCSANGILVTEDISPGTFSSRNITIIGNTIDGVGTQNTSVSNVGINISGTTQFVVADNVVVNGISHGVAVQGFAGVAAAANGVVSGNVITGHTGVNTDGGVFVIAGAAGQANDITVRNNEIYNNDGAGVRLVGNDRFLVDSNRIYDNGNAQSSATDVNASGISITALGFTVSGVIKGNWIYDTRGGSAQQTYGVSLHTSALNDVVIENNIIHGNETGQLNVASAPTSLKNFNNRLTNSDEGSLVAGAFESETSVTSPFFVTDAAEPADSKEMRFGNTEGIGWELATPGTDVTLALDASDILHLEFPTVAILNMESGSGTGATQVRLKSDSGAGDTRRVMGIDSAGNIESQMLLKDLNVTFVGATTAAEYFDITASGVEIGNGGAVMYPPSATEPANCTTANDGSMYFDTGDQKMCICANDGTDDEWLSTDDYSHATGHCSI